MVVVAWVGFNTQPPEGGWAAYDPQYEWGYVSTHSRPKAAGFDWVKNISESKVSTHSRPKAAG